MLSYWSVVRDLLMKMNDSKSFPFFNYLSGVDVCFHVCYINVKWAIFYVWKPARYPLPQYHHARCHFLNETFKILFQIHGGLPSSPSSDSPKDRREYIGRGPGAELSLLPEPGSAVSVRHSPQSVGEIQCSFQICPKYLSCASCNWIHEDRI